MDNDANSDAAEYEFLRLDSSNIKEVVELERICFATPWGEKEFNLAFSRKIFNVFGLKAARGLDAYLAFYHTGEEAEILNIAVRPGRRRSGLGARLLGLMLQIAVKMGIKHIYLEVRQGNEAARNLYGRFGFRQIGVRKAYYPDTGEDALVMKLELNQGRPAEPE